MVADNRDSSERMQRLHAVLAAYLEAVEAGLPAATERWLAEHPELAPELSEFFAARAQIESCTAPLRPNRSTAHHQPQRSSAPEGLPPVLADFDILEEIGRGGMAIVYRARQRSINRIVALKVMRQGRLATAADRQRFQQEAETASRLDHPHIVPIFQVGEQEGQPYIIMQWIEGGSLVGHLDYFRANQRATAELVLALAGAVQHAHQHGIIHRDLKPANVLLITCGLAAGAKPQAAAWNPKISDFGLAKQLETDAGLTQTGELIGTPSYMAPEQTRTAPGSITPATDVYGLGAVLYTLLTRRAPFQGSNLLDTLDQVRQREPAPPRTFNAAVPRDLEAVCLKCLEKEPAHRYPSPAALAADLGRFLAGEPTVARPPAAWKRLLRRARRRPALLLGVVWVVLLGMVVSMLWWLGPRSGPDAALPAPTTPEGKTEPPEVTRRRAQETHARALRHAASLYAVGDTAAMLDTLNEQRPAAGAEDLRGFEWYFLRHQARRLTHLHGHVGPVTALAVAPDGRFLATAAMDETIRIWDLHHNRQVASWTAFHGTPLALRFSPDGQRLVAASNDSTGRVWDVATGKVLAECGPDGEGCFAAAFSCDARTAAGCGNGGEAAARVRCWNTETGTARTVWNRPGCQVTRLRFSRQDDLLAVAYEIRSSPEGKLVWPIDIVEFPSGKVRATLAGHSARVEWLDFVPDGKALVSGARGDHSVRLWDLAADSPTSTPLPIEGEVANVAFAPDGRTVVVSSHTGEGATSVAFLSFWDVAHNGRPLSQVRLEAIAHSLVCAADGRTLILGGTDGVVRRCDPAADPEFLTLAGHRPLEAWAVAFAPDGRTLASAGDDSLIKLWDRATLAQRNACVGHGALVGSVAYSPDGTRLVSGSWDKKVRLWDAATGKPVAVWEGHLFPVRCVAFAPDGRSVASGTRSGDVRLWDAQTGAVRAAVDMHQGQVATLAFSPDGRMLATAGDDGKVKLCDAETLEVRQTLTLTGVLYTLAFSPNGSQLAVAGARGTIYLWPLDRAASPVLLSGHQGRVWSVAFSPDGRTLASGGDDRTVRLWSVAAGVEMVCFKEQPQRVNSVAFAPDGQLLAAALHDGTIRLWPAPREP